ncbi:MAG: tetratricopeptide repeat-containing sensor histidine kinase [Bacteroidetes bacterium]|nr:tetratricopeptide repeat-containing sensor histidine kinase [Bacteroidota bacterium]
MKKLFIAFFLLFGFLVVYGQNRKMTDSLQRILPGITGKERADILGTLGESYFEYDPAKAIKYARELIPLAQKINDPFGEARGKSIIGIALLNQGKAEDALPFFQDARILIENLGRTDKLATIWTNIGNCFFRSGNYDQSYEAYQKSARISESLKDSISYAKALSSMGMVHKAKKEYATALELHSQAAGIFQRAKHWHEYSFALNNQGVTNLALKRYDEALKCFVKSLEIRREQNVSEIDLINLYNNIALVYSDQNNNEQALQFYRQALRAARKADDKYSQAAIMQNLGNLLLKENKIALTLHYFDSSLTLAGSIRANDIIASGYSNMADLYKKKGDYKKAAEYLEKEKEIQSTLMTEKSQKRIEELRIKYETEKSKKELAQRNLDLKKQTIQNAILLFAWLVILLILMTILLFYRSIKRKKTALEAMNSKLVESETSLKESNDTKDKLFSIITHDLKNPFGILISMVSFLDENYSVIGEEQRLQAIQTLKKSALGTSQLLENLTQWALTQGGKLKIVKEKTDLFRVGQSVLWLMKPEADRKKIVLLSDIVPDTWIDTDQQILKTVLRNLIGNAIKFTGEAGYVELGCYPEGKEMILFVKDNGVGIAPEDQEKIFRLNVHHTTSGTYQEKGSGLGLILVKEFASKIEGRIFFNSCPGEGSTFYLALPNNLNE